MPQQRQPVTLLSLCHKRVAANIVDCCTHLNNIATTSSNTVALTIARRNFRSKFINALPGAIRCQLIEEATKLALSKQQGHGVVGNVPTPLLLVALLLANDVRRLRVELCCYYGCSHQAALLKLLASDGRGLESLELARTSLLRLDRSLLQDALLNAPKLQSLTLQNIASDTILQVIGFSCPHLIHLDVSHSRQVSDAGLVNLLLTVQLRDKEEASSLDATLENTSNVKHKGWGPLRAIRNILRRFKAKSKASNQSFFLEYFEQGSKLCKTLQTLNVANTSVTGTGILLALHHLPCLQSFGSFFYVDRALELLDRALTAKSGEECFQAPTFALTHVSTQRATERKLELLSLGCPQLENLTVIEPHHPPLALRNFPQTLTTLHLFSLPGHSTWINELYDYLALPQGRVLKDLTLNFFQTNDFLPWLDLSQVVHSCPNLRVFSADGADLRWSSESAKSYIPQMPHLRRAQIGRNVMARAVTELVHRAPVLETLHLYTCPDLTDDHVASLASKSPSTSHRGLYAGTISEHLECFYVYDAPLVTPAAVTMLLGSCRHLEHVGNFTNCAFERDGKHFLPDYIQRNNLKLKATSGAHWYHSECFQTL